MDIKLLEYKKKLIKKSEKWLNITNKILNINTKKLKEEILLILKLNYKYKEVELIFEKIIINSKIKPTKALFCLKMFSLDNKNFKQENLNSIYEGLVNIDNIKYSKKIKFYNTFFKIINYKIQDKFFYRIKSSHYNKWNLTLNIFKNLNIKKKKKLKKFIINKWILATNLKKFKTFYLFQNIIKNEKKLKLNLIWFLKAINNVTTKIKLRLYNNIWNKLIINTKWNKNYKFYTILIKNILKNEYYSKKLFFNKIKTKKLLIIKAFYMLNNLYNLSLNKNFMIIKYYNNTKLIDYNKNFQKILNNNNNKLKYCLNFLYKESLLLIKNNIKFINFHILITFIKTKKIINSFNKIKYIDKLSKDIKYKKILNLLKLNIRLKNYKVFIKLIRFNYKNDDANKLFLLNEKILNLEIKWQKNNTKIIYEKLFFKNIKNQKIKYNNYYNLINLIKFLYNKRILFGFNKLSNYCKINYNKYYLYIGFEKIHNLVKLRVKNYFEEIKLLSKNRFLKFYYNSVWKWKLENNNSKLYILKKNNLLINLKNSKKINNFFEIINNLFIIQIRDIYCILKDEINFHSNIIRINKNEFNNIINNIMILNKILYIYEKNKKYKIKFYYNRWRNINKTNQINQNNFTINYSINKNIDYYDNTFSDDKELLNYINDLKGIFNWAKNLINKIIKKRMKKCFKKLKKIKYI